MPNEGVGHIRIETLPVKVQVLVEGVTNVGEFGHVGD